MQEVTIDREKYIGGSDIPIILGISPFKSRYDLLLEKAGLKDVEFKGNKYTEYGNIMEPKLRNYVNIYEDEPFEEGKYVDGDIRCHTDGINSREVLEIKTTSQVHDNVQDYEVYLVQLLFYMCHTKKEYGTLVVYHRPEDFNEELNIENIQVFNINIKNYESKINEINEAVERFRIELKELKEKPLSTEEELLPIDLSSLAEKIVVLENRLIEMKELEKQNKELKATLKKSMEDNNIKKWETPYGVKITLVADSEDKEVDYFNEELFKEENEELFNKYLEKKIQKGKSGYVKITLPK